MANYLAVHDLYRAWSKEYDSYPNPLIELEQEVVPDMAGDVGGKRILDIGCGTGRYSAQFAQGGAAVTGVDFSRHMLKIAQKKTPCLQLIQADLKQLPFTGGFDLILCSLVLSHIENLFAAISEIARVVSPGGTIIISDLRTDFWLKKNKTIRIFKNFSTNAYKHTISNYHTAFRINNLRLKKFKKLVFNIKSARKHKKLFYLTGFTIGYVFELEKK